MARIVFALVLYIAATLVSIVWIDQQGGWGDAWMALMLQAGGCVALGWLLRGWAWTALALAFLPVVLAGPFGDTEDAGIPIAVFELFLMPANLALIVGAFAAQRAIERRRRTSRNDLGPRP